MLKKVLGYCLILFLPIKAMAWSESLVSNGAIKAIHISELRLAINEKRIECSLPEKIWSDSVIIAKQTTIKKVHLQEMRQAIEELGASSAWTDSLSATNIQVKRIHFQELRDRLDSIICPKWVITNNGSCSGGSGVWDYSAWGTCTGGISGFGYSAWGSCSVTCGGGVQNRTAGSCQYSTNSGSQSRTSTCNYTANSGTQSRTVKCQKGATVLADSACVGPKPSATASCTPVSPSACGSSAALTQSCTPSSPAPVCGTPVLSQSCNTQACCTWKADSYCAAMDSGTSGGAIFTTKDPNRPAQHCNELVASYNSWGTSTCSNAYVQSCSTGSHGYCNCTTNYNGRCSYTITSVAGDGTISYYVMAGHSYTECRAYWGCY